MQSWRAVGKSEARNPKSEDFKPRMNTNGHEMEASRCRGATFVNVGSGVHPLLTWIWFDLSRKGVEAAEAERRPRNRLGINVKALDRWASRNGRKERKAAFGWASFFTIYLLPALIRFDSGP